MCVKKGLKFALAAAAAGTIRLGFRARDVIFSLPPQQIDYEPWAQTALF